MKRFRVRFALLALGAGMCLLLIALVGGIFLSHDLIATRVLLTELRERQIVCPDGLDADLSLSAWTIALDAFSCETTTSPKLNIASDTRTVITLEGMDPVAVKFQRLKFTLPQPPDTKRRAEGSTRKHLLKQFRGVQKTADAIVLAAASLSTHEFPPIQAETISIALKQNIEAEITKLKMSPGQPMVVNAQQLSLATRDEDGETQPRKSWLTISNGSAEITAQQVTLSGSPRLSRLMARALPATLSATVRGLKRGEPRWDFDADISWP